MPILATARLELVPLAVEHAPEMFDLLSDPAIYRYIDEEAPPSVAFLTQRYARLATRRSPDGAQRWLNWIVRPVGAKPVGYVQATVFGPGSTWIAYVIGPRHWRQGYALEAVTAMMRHLEVDDGVERFLASVDRDNVASVRLLVRLGFAAAGDEAAARHDIADGDRLFLRLRQR